MRRLVSWSGGKDAAYALLGTEVDGLLVTYDEQTRSIPVHDVPLASIEAQAHAVGLPLVAVPLPAPCPNDVYVARVGAALAGAGVDEVVFGDVHLADIRAWRESFLATLGVRAVFPLFGREPAELARAIIASGVRATVCAVDQRLDASFVGRVYDERFLADLPPSVDPCGENGEFHTFVFDAPNFRAPVVR